MMRNFPIQHPHPLIGQAVHCARCREATWARGADSGTLARWHIEHYPDCCTCPECCRRLGITVSPRAVADAPKRRKSRYRGVVFCTESSRHKPWHAMLYAGYSPVTRRSASRSIGYYADEAEAARAYDRACWEMYHEPARLNFPDEVRI